MRWQRSRTKKWIMVFTLLVISACSSKTDDAGQAVELTQDQTIPPTSIPEQTTPVEDSCFKAQLRKEMPGTDVPAGLPIPWELMVQVSSSSECASIKEYRLYIEGYAPKTLNKPFFRFLLPFHDKENGKVLNATLLFISKDSSFNMQKLEISSEPFNVVSPAKGNWGCVVRPTRSYVSRTSNTAGAPVTFTLLTAIGNRLFPLPVKITSITDASGQPITSDQYSDVVSTAHKFTTEVSRRGQNTFTFEVEFVEPEEEEDEEEDTDSDIFDDPEGSESDPDSLSENHLKKTCKGSVYLLN